MTIWLTSDEHYGHNNIIKYCDRKYSNVYEMDRDLILRHNLFVGSEDTTIHLGDFTFDYKRIPRILQHLNGEHILIIGNHDRPFKKGEEAEKLYREYGFKDVMFEMLMGNVLFNHFPHKGDSKDQERYQQHRPKNTDYVIVHGHTHQKNPVIDRQINVGVDAWQMAPVKLDAILNIASGL